MRKFMTAFAAVVCCAVIALSSCEKNDSVQPKDQELPGGEAVFRFFKEINAIPRPSRHEEKMVEYLENFAKSNNLRYVIDGKNVIIYKDATAGMEQLPMVTLQGHTDMVCVAADGYDVDFMTEGIKAVSDSTFIFSEDHKTSLGADDGIGLSIILAVLESSEISHGPLECLFTWDEETGFGGASSLTPGILKGDYFFNIDSEAEGEMCIGTAGGALLDASLEYTSIPVPEGYAAFEVSVSGAAGGHSGIVITNGGANAISVLADFLSTQVDDYYLASISGGQAVNIIALAAKAVVLVPEAGAIDFKDKLDSYAGAAKQRYATTDPDLTFAISAVDAPAECISRDDTYAIVEGLAGTTQGVSEWSTAVDNMFEVSNNLGTVSVQDGVFMANCLIRGFESQKVVDLAEAITAAYDTVNTGFVCNAYNFFSSWNPDVNSPLITYARNVYEQNFGKPLVLFKIGAGLELSEFALAYPDMQFITYGPTIYDAHSINERVEIKSVEKCWQYTLHLLRNIK